MLSFTKHCKICEREARMLPSGTKFQMGRYVSLVFPITSCNTPFILQSPCLHTIFYPGTNPSCVTPPPPPPAISCPASNMKTVNRNGQNFKIYCQRSVMVYTHPWLTTTSYGIYRAIQGPELITNDFDTCMNFCAGNAKSNGCNFWPAQSLCSVIDTPPGNFWKVGSKYENPPPVYNGPQMMSMVAVPKRAY